MRRASLCALLAGLLLGACGGATSRPAAPMTSRSDSAHAFDAIAERYVRLALAVGEVDDAFVDAFYGPAEWKTEAHAAGKRPLPELRAAAEELRRALEPIELGVGDAMAAARKRYLAGQLRAMLARLDLLAGVKRPFDEESKLLYDAVAPRHDAAHFQKLLDALAAELPGDGPLIERYEAFQKAFIIPPERLDAVFGAAIAACRERTAKHLALPAGESFRVEYVTGKPWSGYNWYQGGYASLIQVNTELPIYIDRAIDLAAHEGYPGHHVYNALLEQHLVRERGFVEFSLYPLFSPQSLIAEGSANFGVEVVFPGEERARFERDVLYPLAGLDPALAERHERVRKLQKGLAYAGNEAARRYLDGEIAAPEAVEWLMRYALSPRPRAEQRVRFFDAYRSYVINYNLGEDMVRAWVEAQGGTALNPERRWQLFAELLASPRLPADLGPFPTR